MGMKKKLFSPGSGDDRSQSTFYVPTILPKTSTQTTAAISEATQTNLPSETTAAVQNADDNGNEDTVSESLVSLFYSFNDVMLHLKCCNKGA